MWPGGCRVHNAGSFTGLTDQGRNILLWEAVWLLDQGRASYSGWSLPKDYPAKSSLTVQSPLASPPPCRLALPRERVVSLLAGSNRVDSTGTTNADACGRTRVPGHARLATTLRTSDLWAVLPRRYLGMSAFQYHHTYISRERLTDLWRADCPRCGPVVVGQGYRVDASAIAAQHRDAHSLNAAADGTHERAIRDIAAELPGRVHAERLRTHRRPLERRDVAPLFSRVASINPRGPL